MNMKNVGRADLVGATSLVALATAAAIGMGPAPEFGRKDGGEPNKDDGKELKQLATDLAQAIGEMKKAAEAADTEMKNLGKVTNETKQSADQAIVKHQEIADRLDTLEQKVARRGTSDQPVRKSLGQVVTDNDEVKAFLEAAKGGKKGSVNVNVKAIVSALTTVADGSAGDLIVPMRLPDIVTPAQRRLTMRDLISVGATDKNAIQYVKETGFTNNAATVSETSGATKPQSDIQFDLVTSPVTTIAHWVLATRQILEDVPMLQSYIDGRLRYGLEYVEDNQILNGAGTGTDLNGIYTQATTFSQAASGLAVMASATDLDVLRAAILQAALANYFPDGIVLNPVDWATIELTKDTTGRYIIGNPQDGAQPRLWRKPVVETTAMTAGRFLTGAFKMAAELFVRDDASVQISTEDSDNFRKNLVTILAEERAALAVSRPEAFVKGTFSTAITDLTS
jgi:HK97 family phage major capsid protein